MPQIRIPLLDLVVLDPHRQSLLGTNKYHQLPSSRNRRVYEIALQQDIVDLLIIIVLDLHDFIVDAVVPVVLMKVILSIWP